MTCATSARSASRSCCRASRAVSLSAWARALGEFGATITFAGNFQGRTQTLPLLVYVELERDPQVAISISIMLLGVSVLVLGVLRGRWLR